MLEVDHLTKQYRRFKLDDVTFSLPDGFICGYVGENGAGKTTTLNCITQLCHATAGTVTVNGIHYDDDPILYKEQIGYIGDESFFPADMKLKDIRIILKDFYQSFDRARFDQLVKGYQLPEKRKLADYSRGMKVKLMFAAALSRDTRLLVLDEATNGLDPVVRADILSMLQDYIADGKRSILFSTHILEDLEQIADYIVLIHDGHLLFQKTREELLEEYLLVQGGPERTDGELPQMIGMTRQEFGFTAMVRTDDAVLLPADMQVLRPTIEQIMLYLLREQHAQTDKGGACE